MQFRIGKHRGRFCVTWVDEGGHRQRRSLGVPVSEGREAGERALAEFQRGVSNLIRGTPQVVSEIYSAYHADRAAEGKPAAVRIADAWKRLGPTFGPLVPQAMTKALCAGYIAKRQETASNGTIHVEMGYLRAALRHGEREGWIEKAPYVPLPTKPAPRDHHLKRDEVRRLIEAADAYHVKLFIVLAVTTAGRSQAILDLTWDRVNFKRGQIALRDPDKAATAKGRATVPMNETARRWLQEAHQGALSPYVVEWGGRKVGSVKKGVAAAARRAGLECTPHVLRHTAAVWMAEGQVSMAEIAQYLGHRDSRTTERVYARFSPGFLAGAAGSLEI
jgi:integrase